MKCRRCGHTNEADFSFCENCGMRLVRENLNKSEEELQIPSIFDEPVQYRGKYSEEAPKVRREFSLPAIRWNKKRIGILLSLGILVLIWVFASRYGRINDEIPPVIQEYASAVRTKDIDTLQTILVSSVTNEPPNPRSYEGFLRVMEIPGRLNESVRNLEVDLSHLLQDPDYVSNLPVKLLLLEKDGKKEYRIGVETYDIDVGATDATIDGHTNEGNGLFRNFLTGQYTLTYGMNRYPLHVDATNPNLTDGIIVPQQLADQVNRDAAGQTETPVAQGEGTLAVTVRTNAENGRVRINGEDTGGLAASNTLMLQPGDRIQIVDLWKGGVGVSEEFTVKDTGTVDLPVEYDTEEFRTMIYSRIRAMLIEDALMLGERNADGFETLTGEALENAVDNVEKLIRGNQAYAGTYDSVAFDPESFRLNKTDNPTVHMIGEMTYVYQTYTIGTPEIDVADLWRDDVVMSFDIVLDKDSGDWLISDWGRTDERMSDAEPVVVEIIK